MSMVAYQIRCHIHKRLHRIQQIRRYKFPIICPLKTNVSSACFHHVLHINCKSLTQIYSLHPAQSPSRSVSDMQKLCNRAKQLTRPTIRGMEILGKNCSRLLWQVPHCLKHWSTAWPCIEYWGRRCPQIISYHFSSNLLHTFQITRSSQTQGSQKMSHHKQLNYPKLFHEHSTPPDS